MKIDERLNHLSEEQINEIVERYYRNEKVSELISEFNINCRSSELVKLFPPEILDDKICIYCNIPMIRNYVSRGGFEAPVHCHNCLHKFEDVNCKCQACNETKMKIVFNKYKQVSNIPIQEISFKNRVYLATILRGMEFVECEGKIVVFPLDSTKKKLAPTLDAEIQILIDLQNAGIISAESNSDLDAFYGNLVEENYGDSYYVKKVRYSINVDYSSELSNPNIDLNHEDFDGIYSLCREILLGECYDYLNNQMNKVSFNFNPGITTKEVFDDLLDKFSLGQVYAIIYNSITNATRYYQEQKVYKKQAANSVITRCRAYGERIIANGWEIKAFSRPQDCEQSILSSLFFNRVFPIGDKGYNMVCTIKSVQEYLNEMNYNEKI